MPNLLHKKIYVELFGEVNIYFGLGVLILTSLLLGGLIGFDRERKMKSAGIKTNLMICLGATLYTALSLIISKDHGTPTSDPSRIAAQIVSGIGFLGAGSIIQGRGSIKGLTTAATIWVVAAIGVTIGAGYPLIASLFTVTILVVLNLINPLYRFIEQEKDFKNYHVEVLTKGSAKRNIKDVILQEIDTINEIYEEVLNKDLDSRLLNVYITIHPRKIADLRKEIKEIIKVEKVNVHLTDHVGTKKGLDDD
ncbi:MAG: MgtC/SapB family protein [Deltaproteobacteria bacterium]|nr:MAG: MgtC/SapB family protein [Deltaproteobacteria bacterium]